MGVIVELFIVRRGATCSWAGRHPVAMHGGYWRRDVDVPLHRSVRCAVNGSGFHRAFAAWSPFSV